MSNQETALIPLTAIRELMLTALRQVGRDGIAKSTRVSLVPIEEKITKLNKGNIDYVLEHIRAYDCVEQADLLTETVVSIKFVEDEGLEYTAKTLYNANVEIQDLYRNFHCALEFVEEGYQFPTHLEIGIKEGFLFELTGLAFADKGDGENRNQYFYFFKELSELDAPLEHLYAEYYGDDNSHISDIFNDAIMEAKR